jgi:hypothetical protein
MTTELLHRLAIGLPRFARHDSERVFARIPVTARSEATRQSMDCFVPRNDGDMGLARNDGDMGLACRDGYKGLVRHDVETGVLRGDTLIPVTARSEATWQSMDCFVPRNDRYMGLARNDGDMGLARNDSGLER